jgi:NADPH:quinone reductase-like Zn-dependent oxidoreductase
MKAMRLIDANASKLLAEASVPKPQPGAGEVLIRVTAAGVIRTELDWYPTSHNKEGGLRKNAIPSHEFAGTVAALGDDVTDVSLNDLVFGMNDWFSEGALAEYTVAPVTSIAPAPRTLTPIEAATVPISALTAWQGLFSHGHLHPCDRVLVHGAAGGVGLFATQIAYLHGAHVVATCSPSNFDFVRKLGAAEVIDSRGKPFEEILTDQFDIVLDTIGGGTLRRSLPLLKPGRFAITITSDNENSTDPRIRDAFFIVEPHQKQLFEVAHLLDTGKLHTFVDAVVPLSEANLAYTGQPPGRTGHGKIVVNVA